MNVKHLMIGVLAGALVTAACGKKPAPSLSAVPPTTSATAASSSEAAAPSPEPPMADNAAATGKVAVTKVEKKDDGYTIVLNNVLSIPKVQIREGANGEFLSFPQRNDNGEFWNYVRVNRADGAVLLEQVKSGTPPANAPQGFTITSTKVKMLDSTGKRKAFVEFDLNDGAITLYSWVIIEGNKGPFLAPPSEKSGDDWEDVLKPVSAEFRKALQDAALAEYKAQGGVVPAT
jgi:DNA-binding cell septation regulator SpoVG